MIVICITGGSGSGKTTICNELSKLGYKIIDADQIARKIVLPNQPALVEIANVFDDILLEDGSLNRKKLGSIVFSDKEKLSVLNQITHKYITEEIVKEIHSYNKFACIIDAPLLFDTKLNDLCVLTVGVTADRNIRIKRIMERDSLSEQEAKMRIHAQCSIEESLNRTDYIVDTGNNQAPEILARDIDTFVKGAIHENF